MNDLINKKKLGGLLIALAVILLVFAVLKMSGVSFAGLFLLIAAILFVLFLLFVVLATVFAIGLGKKDFDGRTAFSASANTPDEIIKAKETMLGLHRQIRGLIQPSAAEKAQETYEKFQQIVDAVAAQPEKIPRCLPFFNYYLPTFGTVLEKYRTLEAAGVEEEQAQEKLFSCLDSMNSALDKQYRNLYSDELLDLTVETKALDTIIRKDGLG